MTLTAPGGLVQYRRMAITHDSMLALRREGRPVEAMRQALSLLVQNAADHHAWYAAASLCLELGATDAGVSGLSGVGEELAESGNLPMALACIREIDTAGGDSSDLRGLVSVLYGKGSARLADRLLPPPPLPARVDEEKLENLLPDRGFLTKEADRLMGSARESARLGRETSGRRPHVPYFPMFSALGAEGFLRLVDAFRVRRFTRGDLLMEQGKPSDSLLLLARGEVDVLVDAPGRERRSVAVLGPGALLGEMGMVARTPRSATVEARSDGIGLVAPVAEIETIAADIHEVGDAIVKFCELRLLENLMSVSPALDPLTAAERTRAVQAFDHLYLEAGEVAIRERDHGKGIFLVVTGEMAVLKAPASAGGTCSGNDVTLLTTLRAGDIFGEISTVMRKPATATVQAVAGTALLFLPLERFGDFTRAFPAVFQKIYEISSEREEEIARICASKARPADDLVE